MQTQQLCCEGADGMQSFVSQTIAITRMNLRGLSGRVTLTAATIMCVALVVGTLLGLTALSEGLRFSLRNSGAADVVIVMRGGSQSELNSEVSREQVQVLQSAVNTSAISPEVSLIVDGWRKSDNKRANIGLRGISAAGIAMRDGIEVVQGRWPQVGTAELVVGNNVAKTYQYMEVGDTITFGTTAWTIVGIFQANGSMSESEVWGDLTAVQSFFNRADQVQSVRLLLPDPAAFADLSNFNETDPRLLLSIQTEKAYFARQAAKSSDLVQKLAWPLTTLMAIGAIIGVLNIVMSSVAKRTTEIGTYRVLGFTRSAICVGLILEYLAICFVAGLLGGGAVYLLLDGFQASALANGVTNIGYTLRFSHEGLLQGLMLATTIGFLVQFVPR
ncbi:conserved hypothetical protein [Pseudovibrio sp. JE062]|nr:conserved hypothetical protein [Pseudovibrio sp. JE062]